jgi:hypothetical protein
MEKRTISAHFKAVKSNTSMHLSSKARTHSNDMKNDVCVKLVPEAPGYENAAKRDACVEISPPYPVHANGMKSKVCVQLVPVVARTNGTYTIATEETGLCNLSTLDPASYFDGRLQIRVSGFSGFPNLMNVEDGIYGNITIKTLKRDRGLLVEEDVSDGSSEIECRSQSQKNARKQALANDALMDADPVAYFTSI